MHDTLVAFRAITMNEIGAAYHVIANSKLLPKYLAEILDLPVKSCANPKDCELRISLKIESLWILTNLSLLDGFNEKLFRENNIQEIIQGLILEHYIEGSMANSTKKRTLSEGELSLLDNMLWLTGNLAADVGYEI